MCKAQLFSGIISMFIALFAFFNLGQAQTDEASKIQAARAATESVFNLGRYLSDILNPRGKIPQAGLGQRTSQTTLPHPAGGKSG